MVSRFEDALLRYNGNALGAFRKTLFQCLDDGNTLRRLRVVSRVFRDLIDHQPGRLFRNLYAHVPLTTRDDIASLEIVAPFCHTLTIIVGSRSPTLIPSQKRAGKATAGPTKRANRLSWGRGKKAICKSSQNRNRQNDTSRHLSIPSLDLPYPVQPAGQPFAQNYSSDLAEKLWTDLFSRCHQLDRLTFRVTGGDPAWPGQTEVETTLVVIRRALERADPASLREVCLAPMHTMGILHLRWHGLGAFAPRPSPSPFHPVIWQRLESLDLQLHNPPPARPLSPNQALMFNKSLYEYLRALAPTLHRLRFVWLDGHGPSPLALHLDPALRSTSPRPALRWPALVDLALGRIAQPFRTVRLLPALAPRLAKAKLLRYAQRDSGMDLDDATAWVEIELLAAAGSRAGSEGTWTPAPEDGSSVYSQSTMGSGGGASGGEEPVSRTSRVVPFMLDVDMDRGRGMTGLE